MHLKIFPEIPKNFVNLHGHSLSCYDSIGYPEEHMRFAVENGATALAITDHGHMNALPYQIDAYKKLLGENKKIKPIFGSEVYFIESLDEWRQLKAEHDKTKKNKKSDEEIDGAVVENEGETKSKNSNILNKRNHLVLLAQNQKGLTNLFKLISDSYLRENYYRYPRIDFAALSKYNEGIIALQSCLGGPLASIVWATKDLPEDVTYEYMKAKTKQFQAIFGHRFFGEIQFNSVPEQHTLNKLTLRLSQDPEINLQVVATCDSHYPTNTAWKDRELYKRLGWIVKGRPSWAEEDQLPSDVDELGFELYPKNAQQMWEAYQKYCKSKYDFYDDMAVKRAIELSYEIAHQEIEEFFPDTSIKLPDFVVPPGDTAESALRKMAFEGLRGKNLHHKKDYLDRLDYELGIIEKRKFSKYFLTMKAIIDRAAKSQIPSTSRGSAGGSLVSYALDITKVDPIRWSLQFERFMTEDEAGGYADIDADFEAPMALKEQLMEEWGKTSVVPISNWNTLQLKTLIKDISRFYGIPFEETNVVTTKMILEATPKAKEANDIKFGVYNPTFEEFKQYSETLQVFLEKYPKVAEHIEALEGQQKSASRHASGIIVGENLDFKMPLINSGGVIQTPWSEGNTVRHLEPLGFVKIDVLGLDTLCIIRDCIRKTLFKKLGTEPSFNQIKRFYDENLHPDKIDFNDQKVWKEVFHDGRFPAIFQMTEPGAQDFCKKVKPINIDDLSAVTAIHRPGALSSGIPDKFLAAREDPTVVDHPHELIAEVLKDTHYMIYQEHIASIASVMGKNISLADGNMLRKVLTKKGMGGEKTQKVKKELYVRFVDGCTEKGLIKAQADDIWKSMEFYSGYGFNKSHSVAYSMISFQCAYLFTYYPSEWLSSMLDHEPEADKAKALSLVQSFGYTINPVDINQSGKNWEISPADPKTLIQPLLSIKGLGEVAIDQIIANRPFKTVEDLLFNPNILYNKLNKKALDVLFRSGAASNLIDSRFKGLKHAWSACVADRPKTQKQLDENIQRYEPEGEFSSEETILNVFELTGNFPLAMIADTKTQEVLDRKMIKPISEFDENLQWCWGVPVSVEQRTTKKGKDYLVVEMIDKNYVRTTVRCWNIRKNIDTISLYSLYMLKPKYSSEWGYSVNQKLETSWKLIKKPNGH